MVLRSPVYEGSTAVVLGDDVGAPLDDTEVADELLVLAGPEPVAADGDWFAPSPLQPAVIATTKTQAAPSRDSASRPSTGVDIAREYRRGPVHCRVRPRAEKRLRCWPRSEVPLAATAPTVFAGYPSFERRSTLPRSPCRHTEHRSTTAREPRLTIATSAVASLCRHESQMRRPLG